MNNVLVISNSYDDYIMINICKYIFDFQINHIFLLKEFHNNEKNNNMIVLCDSIEEAVKKTDYVIILTGPSYQTDTYIEIAQLVQKYKKKLIKFQSPWCECISNRTTLTNTDYDNKKVIIQLLSFDSQLLTLCEVIINNVMSILDARFKQFFSTSTQNLFDGLHGIVKNKANSVLLDNCEYDIIVRSNVIPNRNLLDPQNNDLFIEIDQSPPDYTIIIADNNFSSTAQKLIENILNYRCDTALNLVIKSNFIYMQDGKQYVYTNRESPEENKTVNCSNPKLIDIIKEDMTVSLAYPKDIYRLN